MREFAAIDFILLLSGCKVFLKTQCIRIVNYLFLTILLIACMAYGVIHVFYPKKNVKAVALPNLLPYIEFLYSLLFLALVTKRRETIAQQIRNTVSSLTAKQRSVLRKHAICSAVVVLLLFLVNGGVMVFKVVTSPAIQTGANFDPIRFWKGPVFFYTTINNWLVTGILIYVFYIKMLRFMEENYFISLESRIDEKSVLNNYQLIIERRKLTLLGEELISTFSFLPILFFSYLFIESSSVLIEIIERDESGARKFLRVLPLCYKLIAVFYLITACDNCTEQTGSDTDQVILKLMNSENEGIADREFLIRELERNSERNFTAWKMFSIDRNLMLVFANSLVSFTVLVVQLTQEK